MNKLLTAILCVLLSLLFTLCSANDNSSSSSSSSSKSCDNKMSPHGSCGYIPCLCAPGIPGIPGSPGPAGSTGAAGSPGNHGPEGPIGPRGNKGGEGPRGRRGVQGAKGSQGSSGAPGNKGEAGANGRQGPPGLKGPQGPSGPSGSPGSKGDVGARGRQGPPGIKGPPGSSIRNWKQCAFKNLNDDRDTGLIKECVFNKMSAKTALRVYWAGNFRIYNCQGCCSRWYFTFNGAECSTPAAIDGLVYMAYGTGGKHTKNLHRPRHIEGVCEKLHKGRVRVGFWVGKSVGCSSADAYTGWNSVSRIYIEEISPPQA